MKKILAILSSIIMFSCNMNKDEYPATMDKSIMEKMSIIEMNECIKYDPLMKSIFEKIDDYSLDYTDIEKANFYDLTYKRVYDYFKYIEDNKKLFDELRKEDKWGQISDMKLNKDTLCNTYFFPKASKTPPPFDNNENVVDTTASAF